jgi:O-phosphoseryl-tRNA(Cys) synthetase
MIQALLKGKTIKESALLAGYSATTAEGKIYQLINSPAYKDRIQRHIEAAQIDTNEIIGVLVAQMRFDMADLFVNDEFWSRAKELGTSHLIKKYKRTSRLVGFDKDKNPIIQDSQEIEPYSSQEAAKQLSKVFGLVHLPAPQQKATLDFNAMVERIMQKAIERGVSLRGDELRRAIERHVRGIYSILKQSDAAND